LAIAFLGLSFISFKTLWDPERRDSVIVCARLVHAAGISHGEKGNMQKIPFSLSNIGHLWKPLLLILAFIAVYFLFFYLTVRMVLSVWSCGTLVFDPTYPFYEVVGFGSNFLMILVGLHLIWGVSIIKEACK
jgi:hypothetical protein